MNLYAFLTTAGLLLQCLGLYAIWLDRWNIPAHLQVGFAVTAFVVPGLFTDVLESAPVGISEVYLYIQLFGGLSFVIGVLFSKFSNKPLQLFEQKCGHLLSVTSDRVISQRVFLVAAFSAAGLIVSFFIMGFVPAFADEPLVAKNFKGDYQEMYYRAAWLYRLAYNIAIPIVPVVLSTWWSTKKASHLFLGVLLVLLLIATLTRGPALTGVIIFIGLLSAYHRRMTGPYILSLILIFGLGSAANYAIAKIFDIQLLLNRYESLSFADVIRAGAPDIDDHFNLLSNFLVDTPYTYGRTFVGGLVPYSYKWNPSAWTLLVANPTVDDISDIASGGFRVPVAMWGFLSFSWFGVVAVPFLSGLLIGFAGRLMKHRLPTATLPQAAVLMSLFSTLFTQASEFYAMSIHHIPAIAMSLYLAMGPKIIRLKQFQPADVGALERGHNAI